jgi:hypothetical protein
VAKGSAHTDVRPKIYVRTTPGNNCWYINGKTCDISIQWLVDTGASPNVLDWKVYQKIDPTLRPALHSVRANLQAAEGTPLTIYGETNIEVILNSQVFNVKVIVADLQALDGILGMNFLGEEGCVIDTYYAKLITTNMEVRMHRQCETNCCVVRLMEDVTVLPDTECVIPGVIDSNEWDLNVGLVEPSNSLFQHTGILLCNAIVNSTKTTINMTCANLSTKPVSLKQGITLATLQPIDRVVCIKNEKIDISKIPP